MKILHVITSLRTGGAEKLMVDLLPRLRDLGKEVDLLLFDGVRTPFMKQLEAKGIKVMNLSVGCSVYNPLFVLRLIPIRKRYDVVHTHNTACQYFVALANLWVGTRIITTEHSTSNRRRGHHFLKSFDRWMYRQYEKIVTVSDAAGQNIKDYVGVQGILTKTIANGIDVEKFHKANPVIDILTIYQSSFRAIMVAGFRYEKDQQTVIKAFSLLPNVYHLFLVGDGEKLEDCKALSRSLGLQERIHFLGIRMDVPNLLQTVDVVVMSSHREGLSLSNLEGMASGKPFIASDVEGLHSIVNGYGLLFPHGDAQMLADAITHCCEDKKYATLIGKKCYERALDFDIKKMAENYSLLYS